MKSFSVYCSNNCNCYFNGAYKFQISIVSLEETIKSNKFYLYLNWYKNKYVLKIKMRYPVNSHYKSRF